MDVREVVEDEVEVLAVVEESEEFSNCRKKRR